MDGDLKRQERKQGSQEDCARDHIGQDKGGDRKGKWYVAEIVFADK